MAITCTARGTDFSLAGGTTGTFSPASNFAAGSLAVCVVASDNSEANGVAFATLTLTDTNGNTWTRREMPIYDPGAAEAGITGAIFTSPMDGGTLTTGSVITITTSTATDRRVAILWEVVPTSGYGISYVDSGVGTGSDTTTPTVTTGSITNGNIVVAAVFVERNTVITADADTTNGTWSAQQDHGGGSNNATGIRCGSQYKVVTSTATQSYDTTLAATADSIAAWMQLTETVLGSAAGWKSINNWWLGGIDLGSAGAGSVNVTPTTVAMTLTGLNPTVAVSDNQSVTPSTVALTLTGFAPTVVSSDAQTVTPSTVALTLTGLAPTVAVTAGSVITPGTVALTLTGFAPTATATANVDVTHGAATLILNTFAPVITGTSPAYETARHILYGTSLQRHTLHATTNERHTLSGSTP